MPGWGAHGFASASELGQADDNASEVVHTSAHGRDAIEPLGTIGHVHIALRCPCGVLELVRAVLVAA